MCDLSPNVESIVNSFLGKTKIKEYAIYNAAVSGNLEIIKKVNNIKVLSKCIEYAAKYGNYDIVKFISRNAKIDLNKCMYNACLYNHENIVGHIAKNYKTCQQLFNNGLLGACQGNNEGFAKFMDKCGANNFDDALAIAIKNNSHNIIDYLIDHVDYPDTLVLLAVLCDNAKVVKTLLSRFDCDIYSVAKYAIQNEKTEMLKMILENFECDYINGLMPETAKEKIKS